MEKKVFRFDVEKLDVFKVSVEFVRYARSREAWFKGDADRKRQLWRAADSIALNIAEGAGRIAGREKLSFYRVALGSASECVAFLSLLQVGGRAVREGRVLLARIGAMLTRMLRR